MLSKKTTKIFLIVMLLLSVMMGSFTVSADELDKNAEFSMKIVMKDSKTGKNIIGGEFAIYHVAVMEKEDADFHYELTEKFKRSGKDLTTLDNPRLADELEKFAVKYQLKETAKAEPKDGKVIFKDLGQGLYLVRQTKASDGYLPAKAFLVSVPMRDEEREVWIYDVDATPKMELKPEAKKPVTISVKKVWADSDKKHPSSVTAGLYEGGKLKEKVTLSNKNNWRHQWKNLDGNKTWDVKEIDVPKGYKDSYQKSDKVITITNSATLIQTGQWNWPVPVLALTGLVLILTGVVLLNGKRKAE